MFIYAVQNVANQKLYVGLTALSVATRWTAHVAAAKAGSKYALHRAIRKYGAESFAIEVIASLLPGMTHADLCALERDIIAQEGCMTPRGYNMTAGGEGTLGLVRGPMSQEQREHRSAIGKGRPMPAGHGAKVSAGKRAKNADPVARAATFAKASAAWTPKRREAYRQRRVEMNKTLNTPEHVAGLVARNRSEKQRAAASSAMKARKQTETEEAKQYRVAMIRAAKAAKRTQQEAVN